MAELMLQDVYYRYPGTKVDVLKGITVRFPEGKLIAVRGRSGAGKSTLLYLLSGLDVPTGGQILYNSKPLTRRELDNYRRHDAATIAQSYLLFPTWTALENVMYPMELDGISKKEAAIRAREYLSAVGLGQELWNRLPGKLSGGEQQRVAIARCLGASCSIIAADEPTGNLDEDNAEAVLGLLQDLAHKHGKTVIVVTHDSELAAQCDLQYRMRGGLLEVSVSGQ